MIHELNLRRFAPCLTMVLLCFFVLSGCSGDSGGTVPFNTLTAASLHGLTTDGNYLYVADTGNSSIRQVMISTGVVTTLAGTAGTTGTTNGTGSTALFSSPYGITTDGKNLYVADMGNSTIRQVVISSGVVTTLAGTAGTKGATDGSGAVALFSSPAGIVTDGTDLYVADSGNSTIRKVVISSGVVSTVAGSAGTKGATDGVGVAARFSSPYGITTDGTNLYVADTANNTIRKIAISSGVTGTLAGTAGSSGSSDGTGSAARFNAPYLMTSDATNLYLADGGNNTIRKIEITTGIVTTLAGKAGTSGSSDGVGVGALFNSPRGIVSDTTNLYVADTGNNRIRKVAPDSGVVTTLVDLVR